MGKAHQGCYERCCHPRLSQSQDNSGPTEDHSNLGCEVHKSLRNFQIQDLQHCPPSVVCITGTLHPWSSRISLREPARSDPHAFNRSRCVDASLPNSNCFRTRTSSSGPSLSTATFATGTHVGCVRGAASREKGKPARPFRLINVSGAPARSRIATTNQILITVL